MKKLFICICLISTSLLSFAQVQEDGSIAKYRRSSLYSIQIKHSNLPYGNEISTAFLSIPMPDKFNDHNLELRAFESSAEKVKQKGKKKDQQNLQDIESFTAANKIANKMVAKWFNRNASTGGFNMQLIQERGFYDASQLDIANAELFERGKAVLGDAGEQLIGKTFLLVNDITFVDKGENSAKAATGLHIAGRIAGSLLNSSAISQLADVAAVATNEIDGFTVNITSYLYRLVWDEETASSFYKFMWYPDTATDPQKMAAFDSSDSFKLSYVGSSSTSAANLSSKSFSKFSKEEQMLKVCARAVDKSIVMLQRTYEEFKVNVPVYRIAEDGKTVEVQIGLKEGINEKSEFDVLMPVEAEDGTISYKTVGRIKAINGKIWDNRFGALEEAKAIEAAKANGENADKPKDLDIESVNLNASTFRVLSGGNRITPGCLVREATIKK